MKLKEFILSDPELTSRVFGPVFKKEMESIKKESDVVSGSPKLPYVHQMIEESKMDPDHSHTHNHDHQTKQEDPIDERLSGKFSGI